VPPPPVVEVEVEEEPLQCTPDPEAEEVALDSDDEVGI